jgi:hypothetical protein
MNEALAVNASESGRQPNRDAQDASEVERLSFAPPKHPIQRLAPGIREDQHRPTVATRNLDGPSCPRGIKVDCERAFVFELQEALGRLPICGGCDDQDGGEFTRRAPPVERKLPAVPQVLQQVTNMLWHGVPSTVFRNLNENCKHRG